MVTVRLTTVADAAVVARVHETARAAYYSVVPPAEVDPERESARNGTPTWGYTALGVSRCLLTLPALGMQYLLPGADYGSRRR